MTKEEKTILIDEPKGPSASDKVKKKGGKPKSTKYLPWVECRQLMRDECLASKTQFDKWYLRNQPKVIPRFPYRVYTKEWAGWNDFLNTDNKFNARAGHHWRTLLEAAKYVHTLKLNSAAEWLEHCRSGKLPDDIPKRPEITYNDWISWSNFLGNTPASIIAVLKEAQKTQIYYIVHEIGAPENVLTFGIEARGISGMKDRYGHGNIHIVKMFWHNTEKAALIKQVVEAYSSPYMGQANQRIVPNVYLIIEIIQYHLDTINKV